MSPALTTTNGGNKVATMKTRNVAVGLLALLALSAGVRASAGESSLGVELGYVDAKVPESTLFFAGDFRFHLAKSFALAPEFSYWKKSESAVGISSSLEDLQFGVKAVYVFRPSRIVELFVGAGGGLHHLTGNVGVTGGSALSDSLTKGGLSALGGIDLRAGDDLSFFIAARYDWVLGLEPGQTGDTGRLDQKKFSGGFRVRF
jgi:hypothetical protein